jgi:exopolyphosphatase/guanosine-5'-triphosphate,3'-diphosphate pyrophosphatase
MDEEPDAAVSLELGAGRLTRDLLPGDPPAADVVREARREIRKRLAAAVRPISKVGPVDRAVGTSKTMRSLARVAGAAPSSEGPYAARDLELADVTAIVGRLTTMTAQERSELPGVSAGRSRQLLAGALVAEAAMDLLGFERLDICPWALREGIILDRLDQLR